MEAVVYEVRGKAAWLTINRPDQRNAINLQVQRDLIEGFELAKADSAVRIAVLTGAGDKAFCAGGDLGGFAADASPTDLHYGRGTFTELFRRMGRLGKPILGAVNGHALAGGMGLALACDVVIASDNATFGLPEANIGLWPMMITPVIARSIGRKKTLELMFTARRIDAHEALKIGAINAVVPQADFANAVEDMIEKLATGSPAIVRLGRDAFYASQDMTFEQALDFLQAQFTVLLQCEDVAEGVSAFFQKRQPEWKGR